MDGYITMRAGAEAVGEFEDRRSRFIAQIVHVESEDAAAAHVAAVRARHYDARHNVPAWILSDGRERASDDGEPQRTSGMPTLEVLRGAGLRDVCCVTTRYFGGTLLGPGGLVRAYTAAAQAAVESARAAGLLVEMTPWCRWMYRSRTPIISACSIWRTGVVRMWWGPTSPIRWRFTWYSKRVGRRRSLPRFASSWRGASALRWGRLVSPSSRMGARTTLFAARYRRRLLSKNDA